MPNKPVKVVSTARIGAKIIEGAREALAYARGEIELETYTVQVPGTVDVKAIRAKSGLSQSQFAGRYGFNLRTLQDWETGKSQPPSAVRAYMIVIDRAPAAVAEALRENNAA
jgi:putative transcriptional regulator